MSDVLRAEGHPSALVLEGFAHGTEGLDFSGLSAHLERCADCREALEKAQAANAEFSQEVLPRTRAAATRVDEAPRWRLLVPAMLVPALGLALVVLAPRSTFPGSSPGSSPRSDDLRTKGEPALTVFSEREGSISPVADGALLNPGDRVRFAVDSPKLRYLLIVSVDAAGHDSVYVPFDGKKSAEIDPAQRFVSPGSITLDPVAGPERVFVFLSREPIEVQTVMRELQGVHDGQAIRDTHRLNIPAETQLSLFWVNTGNE